MLLHVAHLVGEECICHWLSQDENCACPLCRTAVCERPVHEEADLRQEATFYFGEEGEGRIYTQVGSILHRTIESSLQILHARPFVEEPMKDRRILVCRETLLKYAIDLWEADQRGAEALFGLAQLILDRRYDWLFGDPRLLYIDTTAQYRNQHALSMGSTATLSLDRAEMAATGFFQKHFSRGLSNIRRDLPGSPALDPTLLNMFNRLIDWSDCGRR